MAASAEDGPIDRACVNSTKSPNYHLCNCMQQVANLTLTGADQHLAATFFEFPAKAQEVRLSSRASDREFWQRYTNFGAATKRVCSN